MGPYGRERGPSQTRGALRTSVVHDFICIPICVCYQHVTFPAECQLDDSDRISARVVLCGTQSGS